MTKMEGFIDLLNTGRFIITYVCAPIGVALRIVRYREISHIHRHAPPIPLFATGW